MRDTVLEVGAALILREYFESVLAGGSEARLERLCSIVVDGAPLGQHPIDVKRDREEAKRFEELQWAAIALVGCDADLELAEIHSLPTRQGRATADFEGTTRDRGKVRLELARIVFGPENQQNEYFTSIAADAQHSLEKIATCASAGTFVYRVYDPNGTMIGKHEARLAAAELASFIQGDSRVQKPSTSLHPADDGALYPTLNRLGVHVCHSEPSGTPVRVMWEPMTEPVDVKGALDAFDQIRRKKSLKVSDYSDNGTVPVWLIFGAQSLKQKFLALGVVEALAQTNTIDPSPFSRILVGCYTAGVTFIKRFQPPRYTSLTATG